MIAKLELQNIFGITKKTELNFEIKHLKDSQVAYEQGIVIDNDKKVMLSPTFIARNASGKTSTLRAIEFAYTINSIDDIYNIFLRSYHRILNEFLMNIDDSLYSTLSRITKLISAKGNTNDNYEIAQKINNLLNGENEKLGVDVKTINFLEDILTNFLIYYERMYLRYSEEEVDFYNKKDESEKRIKKILELQKEKLVNAFQMSITSSSNLLQKNFNYAIKENGLPILIKIEFSNQTKKEIEIGKWIKFNQTSNLFEDWKNLFERDILANNWWEESHQLISEMIHFIKFKKNADSLEEAFKNYGKNADNSQIKRKFRNFEIESKSDELPRAWFVDDSMIRNNAMNLGRNQQRFYAPNPNWEQKNLLNDLVDFYSFNFINKLLMNIDQNISHIEMQKNDKYAIADINAYKGFKSFDNLSFGTIKVLFLLKKMSIAFKSKQKNNVILVDEIENGLNISLIQFIITLINNKALNKNNTQLFITTHSPSPFSREVINPQCAFIWNKKFIRLGDDNTLIKRTEDLHKIFIPKNYYNNKFWKKIGRESQIQMGGIANLEFVQTDSIGDSTIYRLLDLIEEIHNVKSRGN